MLKLFINDVEYSGYINSNPIVTGNFIEDTIIGNTPSLCLELTLKNQDEIFNNLLDLPFVIKDDKTLIGTYFVIEAPERMTKELNVELYDSMSLTDVRYMSTLMYPCPLKSQLDEMASMCGVDIDYTALPQNILNREINFYDNTLSVRNHLSMIAESTGCNVFSSPTGGLVFKQLNQATLHHIAENDVECYDQEAVEQFTISKVKFDDSILVLERGNDSANTLYMTQDNMYIDKQETIDYVYDIVHGCSFYSARDLKIAAVDDAQLGDIIEFDGYFKFMVLDYKMTYLNGKYSIQELSGSIKSKNLETMQTQIPDAVKIRRLKVITDQNNASLQIISEEQEELENQFASFSIDLEKINLEVQKSSDAVYKFESGRGNIFDNCNQLISKDAGDTKEISLAIMPLGVNKEDMVGKDICVSVSIRAKNAIPRTLRGIMGAYFNITYEDGTMETYPVYFCPGALYLQITLATVTQSVYQRIYAHYKLPDKPIKYVSNLAIIISCNGEQLEVSNPKVEYGTNATGFEFDFKTIRDNITTVETENTQIKQEVNALTLQAVSMTDEITTINGSVSTLQTRLQSAEIKLEPTNILLAVNEKIGADGKLYSTKFMMDKNGVHVSGGGLDISNNYGEKVFYADTEGNLTIKNLSAINGAFTGAFTSTGTEGTQIVIGNGRMDYFFNNNRVGMIASSLFDTNTRGLMLACDATAKYLMIGQNDINGDGLGYYFLNFGLNPSGWKERHVFLDTTNFLYQPRYGDGYCVVSSVAIAGFYKDILNIYHEDTVTPYLHYNTHDGNAYAVKTAFLSDIKLKRDIMATQKRGLEAIRKIQHVEFTFKSNEHKRDIGYIANQLKEIDEQLTDDISGTLAVNTDVLMPYISKAVQELDMVVQELSNKVTELEGRALYAQS